MQIRGFHIDGFGIYHDQGVQDLPDGLVLFLGDNESGKTTLMEFFRTVLFGWDRKRSPNDYQPLYGGNHGGRLQIALKDGRKFVVERLGRHATITPEGGPPERANLGDRLFAGLDRHTFTKVFAVGLEELQGLEVLSPEHVSGRLFSASAGLGATSLPGALKSIDKEMENLLLPRGQKRINRLVQRLKELDVEIQQLQGLGAAYAQAQQQLELLEAQIKGHKAEEGQTRQRLLQLQQLEQAREPWVRLVSAREKAKAREFAREFPPQGLERLENLKSALISLSPHRQAREEEAARLAARLPQLTVDQALLAQRQAIEDLQGERKSLDLAIHDYPRVQGGRDQAAAEFGRRLQELGPDWDEARLAQVDTSVQMRQRVQELARGLAAAERRHEEAQASQRTLAEAAAAANDAAAEAQRQWQELPPPPGTSPQEIQEQQAAVRQLRLLLAQRELLAVEVKAQLQAQEEAAIRETALQEQLKAPAALLPRWLPLALAAAGLALAGALAYQRAFLPAGLRLGAGLGLALLAYLFRRRQTAAEGRRASLLRAELEQLARRQENADAAIQDLQERLAARDRELDRVPREAALPRPADLIHLEKVAGDLAQAAEQWREWQAREREKIKAETQGREAAARLAKAQEEMQQAARELSRLKEEWAAWLAAQGFSQTVRPEGFEAVLQAVEHARAAARRLREESDRLSQLESYLAEVRGKIRQVLEHCSRPVPAEVGVEDLDALRSELAAVLETARQRQDLLEKLEAVREEAAQLREQERRREEEIQELLARAGAADEEAFRRLALAHQEWRDCLQKMEGATETLTTLAGSPEALPALEEELSRRDPLKVQEEQAVLQARLQELTEALTRDNRQVGDLNRQLRDLAQNERLGALLLEERSLKEQLTDAVKRWATLALCRHLLEQARGVYERERQPQVIQEAHRFLNLMVPGRYRLVSSLGEDQITLEDTAVRRKEEIHWSAGLKDQVYLAIRLGLAREFGRHTEPLPVILDDVLVKFDRRRRQGAARVILDFARGQQIMLFSSHPEFQEIFAKLHQEPEYQSTPVACYTIVNGGLARATPPGSPAPLS